jgi:hypothetical protein
VEDVTQAQVGAIMVGGLAAVTLLFGLFWMFATMIFLSRAQTTTGTVTFLVQRGHSSGDDTGYGISYAPRVRFDAADGRQVSFVPKISIGEPPPVGSSVEVLHLPNNPQKAHLKDGVWLGPVISLFLGVLMGGGALLLAYW